MSKLQEFKSDSTGNCPAAERIDQRIAALGDWRGEVLRRIRTLIQEAGPGIVEEWKWENPVWCQDGIICTGESYKAKVKLTFPKGASLPDPAKLFNASLDGNARRAIDINAGDAINADAFKALIHAAIARNATSKTKPAK